MEIRKLEDYAIARVTSNSVLIKDTVSILDFVMSVQHETSYNKIIVDKCIISEDFFDLKTKLLGEAFQKLIIYDIKLGIIGDFSAYESQSLKDYIYECNQGRHICFAAVEQEAIDRLK